MLFAAVFLACLEETTRTKFCLVGSSAEFLRRYFLQERSAEALEASIRWADGFLLLYSITQRLTFLDVPRLKKLVESTKQSLGRCCSSGASITLMYIFDRSYSSMWFADGSVPRLLDLHSPSVSVVPTVVVANKSDMEIGREVTTEEGLSVARDLRSVVLFTFWL